MGQELYNKMIQDGAKWIITSRGSGQADDVGPSNLQGAMIGAGISVPRLGRGLDGDAFYLDGISQYVRVADVGTVLRIPSTPMSIVFWIRLDGTKDDIDVIECGNTTDGFRVTGHDAHAGGSFPNYKFAFYSSSALVGRTTSFSGDNSLKHSQVQQVAAVLDTGVVTAYIDTLTSSSSTTAAGAPSGTDANSLYIGRRKQTSLHNYLPAQIGPVVGFPGVAITQSQLQEYNRMAGF